MHRHYLSKGVPLVTGLLAVPQNGVPKAGFPGGEVRPSAQRMRTREASVGALWRRVALAITIRQAFSVEFCQF